MARLRGSRSPSPGRHRKDDDRRERSRRNDRDVRRRSRSRSPADRHFRDRDARDPRDRVRDRDRERDRDDGYRRKDRSPDRRGDEYYRGSGGSRRDGRDRRRSRDRFADDDKTRDRSPERRRRDANDRPPRGSRRDDSRDRRGRRERPSSPARSSRRDDSRPRTQGSSGGTPDAMKQAQSDVDKKAERLAKLAAWKKKKENQAMKESDANPLQTRRLLAEMDEKSSKPGLVASPAAESPPSMSPTPNQPSGEQSPSTPYTGKFDPKEIAKKAASRAAHTSAPQVLGSLGSAASLPAPSPAQPPKASKASALPVNRGHLGGFGFGSKLSAANEKLASKRKIDLDEEDTSKRKLVKLPALPLVADDTPYADQDDDESDEDGFAENEEEAAAAARAAHERRLAHEQQPAEEMEGVEAVPAPQANGVHEHGGDVEAPASPAPAPTPAPVAAVPVPATAPTMASTEAMEVDDEDDVDPLDAFMADLQDVEAQKTFSSRAPVSGKPAQEPEAYFSDDDAAFREADGSQKVSVANKRKRNKDIPTVDYSKLNLAPVRKNFWVEPAELSNLTEAETAELRAELDGIKVSGKNVPKPVQKWAQCGLTRHTLEVIEDLGYEKPTPIQMQAIPTIMSGRDVIGVAKTGSGKTVAFLLPMFRHILDQDHLKENEGPIALIMTPTRELAVQIHRDCRAFLKAMKLRSVCAYGGAPISEQIAELKRGAEIVVCTPGRMIDLLAANQGRVTNLKRVSYVVLDEADRMFDMGFEPQVMKIFAGMRPDKQTILFSATMPRIIDALTKKVLKNPVEVTVGGRSVVAPEITQIVEVRDETSKFHRLLELLGELYDQDEDARTLIFVDRQEKADDLLKELMVKGYPCMSIHGGKDQIDRDSTISDFKRGIVPILIATSIAARGLDVKQLKLVVNYDAPNHLEDYVHRAGRTGRAGNKGTAVTFVREEEENCAVGIAKALEQSGTAVPERLAEMRKAYREKVKSGKAKESSGFGGKGLDRLDQEREAARMRERKTHKAEGDEEDFKEDKPTPADDDAGPKPLSAVVSSIVSREAAKAEDSRAGTPREGATGTSKDPLDKVSSAVSAINSRLGKAGQLRSGQPIDNKGPDAGAFHATLEINDFPQKARWAVTNRTNVAKILEATGTSITTKGNFYPAGKVPGPNQDPKLYILVEGDTELVVGMALQELTRLLTEGTKAAEDAASRAPVSGRYTVT